MWEVNDLIASDLPPWVLDLTLSLFYCLSVSLTSLSLRTAMPLFKVLPNPRIDSGTGLHGLQLIMQLQHSISCQGIKGESILAHPFIQYQSLGVLDLGKLFWVCLQGNEDVLPVGTVS